ncbi:hypothetical protein KRX51_03075 [Corynebacterium sp. TAE3-ERU12]|uniref:hypothetical protein n=1 Tax=Corynebacterium sp. TAE3-ERU12 TaxID=2849491 RepID=UPI001C471BA1|nr:hypothetical protein [Corynebacterium sp. TAE3-ERU12]MBV7294900.1 hypothetical protein [Corynebacterium sp. TAE3-ERU12]
MGARERDFDDWQKWEWVNARIPASISREFSEYALDCGVPESAILTLIDEAVTKCVISDEVFDQLKEWTIWGLSAELISSWQELNAEFRKNNK